MLIGLTNLAIVSDNQQQGIQVEAANPY